MGGFSFSCHPIVILVLIFYWRVEIVAEMVNLLVILLVQCFVVDSWAKPSIKRTVNPPVDVLSFNSTQLIRTVKELTVRDQC